MNQQLNTFQVCAKSVEDTVSEYVSLAKNERDYELEIRKLNDLLMLTERAFIDYNGLPNRPFFRHIVYGTSLRSTEKLIPRIFNVELPSF